MARSRGEQLEAARGAALHVGPVAAGARHAFGQEYGSARPRDGHLDLFLIPAESALGRFSSLGSPLVNCWRIQRVLEMVVQDTAAGIGIAGVPPAVAR